MNGQRRWALAAVVAVAMVSWVANCGAQGFMDLLGVRQSESTGESTGATAPTSNTSLLGGLTSRFGGVVDALQGLRDQFKPDENELKALQYILWMLQPSKLGGADRTFNQNDIDAIINALLQDPSVRCEIQEGIRHEGQNIANSVGGPGFIGQIRRGIRSNVADRRTTPGSPQYGQYWAQGVATARCRIRAEIEQGLAADRISPAPGQGPSTVARTVTRAEMDNFKNAVSWMKRYSNRVSEKLGFTYDLPRGLSETDVQAIINGTPPPNGVRRSVR